MQPSVPSIIRQFTFVCLDAFCAKASGQCPTLTPHFPLYLHSPLTLARLTFTNGEDSQTSLSIFIANSFLLEVD